MEGELNNSLTNNLSESLGGLTFGVDENGNYGYIKAGADTVTPFSSNFKVTKTTRSWVKWSADLGNNFRYDGTIDKNLIVGKSLLMGPVGGASRQVGSGTSPTLSYNASTGKFSLTTGGNWEIRNCTFYTIEII